jgi:hypothetical protein
MIILSSLFGGTPRKKNKDLCYQLPTLISSWFEPVFVAMAMQDTSILEYLASWIVLDTWRAAEQ